jgi:platelet-activating factor acetylhydrolase
MSNLVFRLYLPHVPGRFPVGMTTFVTPISPSQLVGTAKLKNTRTGQLDHALTLEEVAFSAYYPADISSNASNGVPWLLR